MTPGYIERHQDYVLGPNQDARLASVAAGLSFSTSLQLDSDGPFILRGRALRVQYDSSTRQQVPGSGTSGLNHVLMRWSGPDRDFRSQSLIRQALVGPYFGQIGNPLPVYPEVFYPKQASINVDVQNDGSGTLTNLTFYFRGVKLFGPGAVKSYRYPARFGLLPFVAPRTIKSLPVTTGPIRNTLLLRDADFVLRGGQAGDPFDGLGGTYEVFIRILDEDEKPYSNDAVHADVMFGNSNFATNSGSGMYAGFAPVGAGPNSPGLFVPEIYVPRNHVLYYEVSRSDAYVGGLTPVDYPLSFIGQKVFPK